MKKRILLLRETIRVLTIAEVGAVTGGSVAGCPYTIGQACLTLRSCVGHATCLC